jgi:hypothetical protein
MGKTGADRRNNLGNMQDPKSREAVRIPNEDRN